MTEGFGEKEVILAKPFQIQPGQGNLLDVTFFLRLLYFWHTNCYCGCIIKPI